MVEGGFDMASLRPVAAVAFGAFGALGGFGSQPWLFLFFETRGIGVGGDVLRSV